MITIHSQSFLCSEAKPTLSEWEGFRMGSGERHYSPHSKLGLRPAHCLEKVLQNSALKYHVNFNPFLTSWRRLCLAVTGGGSVSEYGRFYQPSWLLGALWYSSRFQASRSSKPVLQRQLEDQYAVHRHRSTNIGGSRRQQVEVAENLPHWCEAVFARRIV